MNTYKLLVINPALVRVETVISAVSKLPIGVIYADIDKPYELIDTKIEVKRYGWLRKMLRKII